MREYIMQYPQKRLNVWSWILNNKLVRLFFIETDLTTQKYENMLRNQIVSAINAIVGKNFQ